MEKLSYGKKVGAVKIRESAQAKGCYPDYKRLRLIRLREVGVTPIYEAKYF